MALANSLLDSLGLSLGAESNRCFVIAFSGGIDSQVLLHAMADYVGEDKKRLLVAHVDHGLHKDSPQWAEQCLITARKLGVRASLLNIDEGPPSGESVESWARRHRYRLLKSIMHSGDVLLTAHHRDDLAETLLLQLFRGSGPHGLASIAERQRFGPGLLVRPLLNVARTDIYAYAQAHGVKWIDDPSNAQERYDRNYIRHRVLPEIERRWPAASARIAHAVELQRQAADCLDEAADAILHTVNSTGESRLLVSTLTGLSDEMQRWVLRRWVVRAGFPVPDAAHLREMQRLVHARTDAMPCMSWKRAELRRYRDQLFLFWQSPRRDCAGDYPWDLERPLLLSPGVLSASATVGSGLSAKLATRQRVVVRFRRGGERCHPLGRSHSQSLKRLFQEWGTPTWLRAETPLVFVSGELAAVAGICVCRTFAAQADEKGWVLHWNRHSEHPSGGID